MASPGSKTFPISQLPSACGRGAFELHSPETLSHQPTTDATYNVTPVNSNGPREPIIVSSFRLQETTPRVFNAVSDSYITEHAWTQELEEFYNVPIHLNPEVGCPTPSMNFLPEYYPGTDWSFESTTFDPPTETSPDVMIDWDAASNSFDALLGGLDAEGATFQSSHAGPAHGYRRLATTDSACEWVRAEIRPKRKEWLCLGDNCGLVFRKEASAYNHVLKQHLSRDKLFECIDCDAQFSSEASAKRHQANQVKKYSCSVAGCSKTFARVDYRNRHLRICALRRNNTGSFAMVPTLGGRAF